MIMCKKVPLRYVIFERKCQYSGVDCQVLSDDLVTKKLYRKAQVIRFSGKCSSLSHIASKTWNVEELQHWWLRLARVLKEECSTSTDETCHWAGLLCAALQFGICQHSVLLVGCHCLLQVGGDRDVDERSCSSVSTVWVKTHSSHLNSQWWHGSKFMFDEVSSPMGWFEQNSCFTVWSAVATYYFDLGW